MFEKVHAVTALNLWSALWVVDSEIFSEDERFAVTRAYYHDGTDLFVDWTDKKRESMSPA